jgi:hypothetical protein
MPIDDTSPPREHYQVEPAVVEDLQRRRSNYAQAGGASEPDLHSFVFLHPELVTCYLDEQQSLVWRKEAKLSTADRVDMFALFYGRSRCDLIECKGPNEPIIDARGITRYLNKSLVQLSGYRDAFTSGLPPDRRLHINIEIRPRLVLIGDVRARNSIPVTDQATLLEKALQTSDKWKDDYDCGLLIVLTWDMLAEKAKKARTVPTSRWCNNVVTRVLGNFAWDKKRRRISLPSIDEFMARASVLNLQDQATLVETRAIEVIKTLKQLQVSPKRELDTESLHSQLQLADWLLYQNDGDMCCGEWGHGSTYGALEILKKIPTVWTAIADHLLKALAKDTSVDVLGRTSHVLRYAPEPSKKLLADERTIRDRWRFPDPEALVTDPLLRPDLVNFMQVGYCLAQHGVEEAVAFMNQAAANPRLLNDIARWDTLHAKENPEQLMHSLRQKAERPTDRQKPFLPWHKAIFEADGSMFGRLKKAGLIGQ